MILRSLIEPLYERYFRMQYQHVPNHIAIIQDGNRRYAKMLGIDTARATVQGLTRPRRCLTGHTNSVSAISRSIRSPRKISRAKRMKSSISSPCFREKFLAILSDERVKRYRIRVQMVGDRSLLPPDLREAVDAAEEATQDNTGFHLNIALAYGGRNEIVLAAREILADVEHNKVCTGPIDVAMVEEHLHGGKGIPPVDLIIRTGNDYRTSNFLPWLANGHESAVYFCAPYWPLFRKIDLMRAIRIYDQRMSAKAV